MNPRFLPCVGWLVAWASGAMGAPPDSVHWRRYEDPVFPVELLGTSERSGFVNLVITYDAEGRISDRLAIEASHPSFVAAVYEASRRWEVETEGMAHTIRRETFRFEFVRSQTIVNMTQRDAVKSSFSKLGDLSATAIGTCKEEELRRPMKPLSTVVPAFPAELAGKNLRGFATIGFVVDGAGRVRVPAVTDASSPEFGEVALAAVRQWRFEPPRRDNLPVQVMADRTFRFGPQGKS